MSESNSSNKPALRYEIRDRIAYITLDRPEVRNAINPEVREGIIESFSDASVNPGRCGW